LLKIVYKKSNHLREKAKEIIIWCLFITLKGHLCFSDKKTTLYSTI